MFELSLFTNAFNFCLEPGEAERWVWSEGMARFIRGLGYEGVELSAKRHLRLDSVLSGGASQVRSIAEKYGLTIVALSSHYNHLDPDPVKREEWNARFMKVIEASSLLDVPIVVTFSGMPLPLHYLYPYPESNIEKIDEAWNDFRETWETLVDHAEQHDVKIAIEAHFGQLVYNTQTIEHMFQSIPNKALGLNLDPSHPTWQLIDPAVIVERFGERIYHTHMKDVEFLSDKMRENGILAVGKWASPERSWRFRIPGKGVINWEKLLEALISRGYVGAFSFEHEDPTVGLEEGAREALNYMRETLKRVVK